MFTEKKDFIETIKYTTPEFRATWPSLVLAGAMFKGSPKGKYEVKWIVDPKSEEFHTLKEHFQVARQAAEKLYTNWDMQYSPFKEDKDKDKKLTGLNSVVFTCPTMRKDEHPMDQPEYSIGQMINSIFGLHEIVDIYRDDDEQWVYKTLDGAEIPESEVTDVHEKIWTAAHWYGSHTSGHLLRMCLTNLSATRTLPSTSWLG